MALALAAAVTMVAMAADDGRPDAATRDAAAADTRPGATTTSLDQLSPSEAFHRAADRLVSAGSFSYTGSSSAVDVSHVRPGMWLAVELTVEGEVSTRTGRVHEIGVDDRGRATETVIEGASVWGRLADAVDELGDGGFITITAESGSGVGGKGLTLLPTWLDAVVGPRDAGTDALGRRLIRGRLPAAVLGEIVDGRPPTDADVVLAVDDRGDSVHVDVASMPTGPPLRLVLDLAAIGTAVVVDLPPAGSTG